MSFSTAPESDGRLSVGRDASKLEAAKKTIGDANRVEIVSVDPLEVAAIDVAGYDDEDPMPTDDEEDE